MQPIMTDEERQLDVLWRARFGGPMPILGAVEIVKRMLNETGPMPLEVLS